MHRTVACLALSWLLLGAAPAAFAHDEPGSTSFDLLVPSETMNGSILFATLIGPSGGEVLHATADFTFVSPAGGTPASEVVVEVALPTAGGHVSWEITGADFGWPAQTGTFQGTLDSHLLNGVLAGAPFADLHIASTSGGVTGKFQDSRITLELAGDVCQADLGFAGPGEARLAICGDALASGGTATFSLRKAPPSALVVLVVGAQFAPTPFAGGTLVPLPFLSLVTVAADAAGNASAPLMGGGGPATAFLQGVVLDASQPGGYGLTNALQVELLP